LLNSASMTSLHSNGGASDLPEKTQDDESGKLRRNHRTVLAIVRPEHTTWPPANGIGNWRIRRTVKISDQVTFHLVTDKDYVCLPASQKGVVTAAGIISKEAYKTSWQRGAHYGTYGSAQGLSSKTFVVDTESHPAVALGHVAPTSSFPTLLGPSSATQAATNADLAAASAVAFSMATAVPPTSALCGRRPGTGRVLPAESSLYSGSSRPATSSTRPLTGTRRPKTTAGSTSVPCGGTGRMGSQAGRQPRHVTEMQDQVVQSHIPDSDHGLAWWRCQGSKHTGKPLPLQQAHTTCAEPWSIAPVSAREPISTWSPPQALTPLSGAQTARVRPEPLPLSRIVVSSQGPRLSSCAIGSLTARRTAQGRPKLLAALAAHNTGKKSETAERYGDLEESLEAKPAGWWPGDLSCSWATALAPLH